jgi:hypothetical protein
VRVKTGDNKETGVEFYANLPLLDRFSHLADESAYAPAPDDWVVGLSDIVRSTQAIEAGRYKVVNTAAASVIAAIANALPPDMDFPFVFGGDGASFALPAHLADLARETLAAAAAWVRDDLGLEMRVALVTVGEVRRHGRDVRVARFAPSPDVSYAMFDGGGLAWAEGRMKAGDYAIEPAAVGVRPDLTGLSCRFDEIASRRGVVLSVIMVAGAGGPAGAYQRLVGDILALAERDIEAGRPVPENAPRVRWPPAGFGLEALAARRRGESSWSARLRVALHSLGGFLLFRTGLRVGGFEPRLYLRQLVANTDYRKFDDGLRMTLDCTPRTADQIEALLAIAQKQGIVFAGTHRQTASLMTCFVPSPTHSDHVHFIDGAMGGYAMAAKALKSAALPHG